MSDRKPVPHYGIEMMWDDDAFLARLREACERAGFAPEDVCEAAGMSRAYLTKGPWRGGRATETILRLAQVLGVDPGELAFGARKA